jgi:hypothetical protein
MEHSAAIEAARHFLTVVWDGEAPTDGALLAALDRLLAAYHETPHTSLSDEGVEAPRQDGSSLAKEVAARFPDYGLYPVADPTKPYEGAAMMGDAIDDLADLTSAMREVIWLAENAGIQEAHRDLRSFFFDWGRHARELSLYLHARIW